MRWLAATLLGLLGLAWALLTFAAPGRDIRPAPDERGAGGLSLLSQALRDAGYRVAYDPSTRPRLGKDDVAIVPVLEKQLGSTSTPEAVVELVRRGGRAFVLGIPDRLQPVGMDVTARGVDGKTAKIDAAALTSLVKPRGQIASASVWIEDGPAFASLAQVGSGRIALMENGVLATNRFLGRLDNARVVLTTLATVARPGDRLVFLASGYGEAEDPGPIEAIGPWAVGALWQSLAVFAAFGLSKGVRFGLPEPEARTRRGTRELLDTLSGHYLRGRRTDAPLRAAARERPDDDEVQALARGEKVPESVARQALERLEAKTRQR